MQDRHPSGWGGEAGGRGGSELGGHMCTRGWLMLMYGKIHHKIVKQLASNDYINKYIF